jgi:hypothetical protein
MCVLQVRVLSYFPAVHNPLDVSLIGNFDVDSEKVSQKGVPKFRVLLGTVMPSTIWLAHRQLITTTTIIETGKKGRCLLLQAL